MQNQDILTRIKHLVSFDSYNSIVVTVSSLGVGKYDEDNSLAAFCGLHVRYFCNSLHVGCNSNGCVIISCYFQLKANRPLADRCMGPCI